MAATILYDAEVTINAVDLSDRVKSVSLPMSVATQDGTTMGDTWMEQLPGLKSWSLTIEFLQDFASGKTHATINPIFGTTVAVTVKPTTAATSATNPEFQGNVVISEYNPLDGAVGDASSTSVTWPGDGAVTVATS